MALIAVPEAVQFSYNAHVFNATVNTVVTETPVTSADNRNVKYSQLNISVSGFITQDEAGGNATLDAIMETMRRRLQVHGKTLRYVSKGYGLDLEINRSDNTGLRDVAMGPKSGAFRWWPLGGAPNGCHAAGFEWEVTTCIPECKHAVTRPGPRVFQEIAYTVTYDTGEDGLVVIRTAGQAQIPLSLQANNTISHTVDQFIAGIIAPPPTGFLRSISRTISEDRSTCEFTITDRQIEIPYPHDVVDIDMKHSLKQVNRAGIQWDGLISGTVRVSPTAEPVIAWNRFYNIAFLRIRVARDLLGRVLGPEQQKQIMPIVSMEEDLFKKQGRFSISYKLVGVPLNKIISLSGLWQRVRDHPNMPPNDRWNASTWAASLRNNAQATKGILGASFEARHDVVIDVCNQTAPSTSIRTGGVGSSAGSVSNLAPGFADVEFLNPIAGGGGATSSSALDRLEPSEILEPGSGGAVDPQRDDHGARFFAPESSWVSWHCDVRRVTDYHMLRHKPLAGKFAMDTPSPDPLGKVRDVARVKDAPKAGWHSDTPDIIHRRASPTMALQLRGFGVRAAYRVEPPKMISYGGVEVFLAHEDVRESTLAVTGGIVMFRTDWNLIYLVPTAPKTLPLPANPAMGKDGV